MATVGNEPAKTFAEAFIALQAKIKNAVKDSTNPAFKSRYADLSAVWDAIKGPLHDNGFAVVQSPDFDSSEMWLKTTILHVSGEKIEGRYPLRPVKHDPQGYGSALTYARRYSISAMLGVIADDDDDGNAASGTAGNGGGASFSNSGPKINEAQAKTLLDLIEKTGSDIEKFCAHFKIQAVPDLPASKWVIAGEMLNAKVRK